jgi:hypothetical protein
MLSIDIERRVKLILFASQAAKLSILPYLPSLPFLWGTGGQIGSKLGSRSTCKRLTSIKNSSVMGKVGSPRNGGLPYRGNGVRKRQW